jgi:hypothetical protein
MLSIPFRGNGADKISVQQTIASGFLKNFWMPRRMLVTFFKMTSKAMQNQNG